MPIPSDTSGLWWLKPDNNWLANAQITAHAMDRTMAMMQQKQQFEQEMQLRMAQFGLQQKKANMDMQLDAIKIREANDEMDDMPKVAEALARFESGDFETPITGVKSMKAIQLIETARNNKMLNSRVLGERNKFVNDLNNLPEDDFQAVADHLQVEGIDPSNIPLNAIIPQSARAALAQGKDNAERQKWRNRYGAQYGAQAEAMKAAGGRYGEPITRPLVPGSEFLITFRPNSPGLHITKPDNKGGVVTPRDIVKLRIDAAKMMKLGPMEELSDPNVQLRIKTGQQILDEYPLQHGMGNPQDGQNDPLGLFK